MRNWSVRKRANHTIKKVLITLAIIMAAGSLVAETFSPFRIVMGKNGTNTTFFVNESPVTIEELEAQVKQFAAQDTEIEVWLSPATTTTIQELFGIIDMITAQGLNDLVIASEFLTISDGDYEEICLGFSSGTNTTPATAITPSATAPPSNCP